MVGEDESEGGGGGGDASTAKLGAEFFEGAVGAFAGGVFGELEFLAEGGEGLLFEETEEDRFAVGGAEVIERVVDFGPKRFPRGGEGGGSGVVLHGEGFRFVEAAALLGAEEGGGRVARAGVEPAGERGVAGEAQGFQREVGEDGLGELTCAVRIPGTATKRGGVHKREMPVDEFAERGFIARGGVAAEEIGVGGGWCVGHGGG